MGKRDFGSWLDAAARADHAGPLALIDVGSDDDEWAGLAMTRQFVAEKRPGCVKSGGVATGIHTRQGLKPDTGRGLQRQNQNPARGGVRYRQTLALANRQQTEPSQMRYVKPTSAAEAASLLVQAKGVTRVLAGGTDVLVQLKAGMVEPELIVDIKHLAGVHDVTVEKGGFRIGAAVPGAVLGENKAVVAMWPGVVEGFALIGSTQVQGRATMAGNLCNASPAGDAVPAMVTANAVARVVGPNGERDCLVADIPVSPGKTSLAKGEIITSIFLPARPERASDAYLRFIPRTEMDIAVASAAVALTLDADGTCVAARVALGAVAPTVILVGKAADCIVGTKLDAKALDALAAACSAACKPIDDKRGTIEFRTKVAGVLARRAAVIAYQRAGGRA